MNKLLEFPSLSYKYDFSVTGTVSKQDSACTGDSFSLVSELRYYVKDEEIIGLFGSEINSLHLDWIDIAMAVYVADRLSFREVEKYRNNWKRNFDLKIAVRNLEIWSSQEIQNELKNVLSFYTDDEWEFEFVRLESNDRLSSINNKLPIPPSKIPRVALYSGGLDSFAGAVREISNDNKSSFILVSGATNNRQEYQQNRQIKEIVKKHPTIEIIHQTIKFGFNWSGAEHSKEENSQRTRGFLFITLGVVTALNAGVNVLEIYENGIGAINLPYDNSQVGTMNSRGVNPLSLLRMEKFVQKITKCDFQIRNLYVFQTKSEMCRHQAVMDLADVISLTFSCDGFPVQTAGKPQCGVCTSCLLRRLSVENANLTDFDDGEHYLTDLASYTSQPSFAQLNDLRAMEWQYLTIKNCLLSENAWQELILEYPILQTIVSELAVQKKLHSEDIQNKILLLFSRYCEEWKNFSARRNFINAKKKAA